MGCVVVSLLHVGGFAALLEEASLEFQAFGFLCRLVFFLLRVGGAVVQPLARGTNFLGVFVQMVFAVLKKLGEGGFWWGIVQTVVEIFPSVRR
ncbi:hypothetical protein [Bartonella sp. B1098]|uniref:hypothetical protein n=1 Tax=Bartonella sp. B1098 TaxID=2911421 RepID=UPI0020C2939C|nr:hypothetical protein [Bartonella sp. B1098]